MWGAVAQCLEWSRVRIPRRPLGNFGNFLYPTLPVFSEETLKGVGPFYPVSMPGGVKDPTQGVNVKPVVDSIFYLVNNVETTLIKNSVNRYLCMNTVKHNSYRQEYIPFEHSYMSFMQTYVSCNNR